MIHSRSIGLSFLALWLSGCHGETSPPADLDPDVPPITDGDWLRPAMDTSWQWQLLGAVNTGCDVDLYDIDLFDSGDSLVGGLQQEGRGVICYFSGGSSEDWRADFGDFDDSDMGRTLGGWAGENWLDIRSQNVWEIMTARLDRAVALGCDGVEPDNMDGYTNNTGFDLTADDQLAFNRNLANAAHERGLAVLLKNDGGQAQELVDYFDASLNEECHAFDECQELRPFQDDGKPIFNAEYPSGDEEDLADEVCPVSRSEDIRTLILPLDLDDSFRIDCDQWAG